VQPAFDLGVRDGGDLTSLDKIPLALELNERIRISRERHKLRDKGRDGYASLNRAPPQFGCGRRIHLDRFSLR
jgi:hypothetical protein